MMADADGGEYVAFASLEAARLAGGATVVMEGDYGGQIYLTCPVQSVNCDESRLLVLLAELDGFGWQDPEGARLYYERAPMGSGVGGGMGGGKVVDGVWLHDELRKLGLAERVQAVIGGEIASIREDSSPR